ncbi:30S ribosomal protein S19 [Candidatus Woesearchaeota archaeon B3_Woes]|nr:MAG: 30S ribosomal protein S19 [Candidatus Woesearchaeota archaeon B3_Woes]
MVKKEFAYRGKSLEELKGMELKEFIKLLPARERRSLKRGFTEQEKKLMEELKKKDNVKTHCRDLIILPEIIGKKVRVHSGKEFVMVMIEPEMIGFRLGDFVLTRKNISHSAPGVGATKSSSNISVK